MRERSPRETQERTAVWDEKSIEAVIAHFRPVFKETEPLGVYIRMGEDSETEQEDLSLLTEAGGRPVLPIQDVLHMVTFIPAADQLTASEKYFEAELGWYRGPAKKDQLIEIHLYPIPFHMTEGIINSLEEAREHFHITDLYEHVYTPARPTNP